MEPRRRHKAAHHQFVQGKKVRAVLLDGTVVLGRFVRCMRDAIMVLRLEDGTLVRLHHERIRSANYPVAGRLG